jgi:hypothetical protein
MTDTFDNLPRPTASDWSARAGREAAAIVAEALPNVSLSNYQTLVGLVAIGWLQGFNYGTHETLAQSEGAFERLRAAVQSA